MDRLGLPRGADRDVLVAAGRLETAWGADDLVRFTRNATDALNLLANALPLGTTVLTSPHRQRRSAARARAA
jgi:hypothetical protein